MTPQTANPRERLMFAGAALAYGLFIALMLPGTVIPLGDDFGYYRSVVATIQHQRPWTDAWLEPWAASLCALSALIFKVTGSFLGAIQGVQVVLAATTLGLTCQLLRERGHSPAGAIAAAALILTFPTFLWKTLEYTSVTIYLPCLLAALWAADRKWWGWFVTAWCVAIASRQSALTWLVIPAWEVVVLWADPKRQPAGGWRAPALAAAGGLAFFGLMAMVMNKTHAQTVITDTAFAQIDPRQLLINCFGGLLAFATAAGIGGFLLRPGFRETGRGRSAAGLGLLVVAFLVLWKHDPRDLVAVEHVGFQGRAGWYYVITVLAIAIAGGCGGGHVFRPRMAVYALGSLALVSLRQGNLWDYYLADIVIFGLLSVGADAPVPAGAATGSRLIAARLAAVALGFVTVIQLGAVLRFKLQLDRARAIDTLFEQSMREGKAGPADLYGATFGFVAWHLQPHFIAHEGRFDPRIARFWDYLKYAVDVRTQYLGWLGTVAPFKHETPADPAQLILGDTHHVWWFFHARYTLEHCTPLPSMPTFTRLKPGEYRRMPYPLNDAEWRELIARERL